MHDRTLHVLVSQGRRGGASTFVNDIILASNGKEFQVTLFRKLDRAFGTKDKGILHDFLIVQVDIEENGIKLHQAKYCQEVLERFGFSDVQG